MAAVHELVGQLTRKSEGVRLSCLQTITSVLVLCMIISLPGK